MNDIRDAMMSVSSPDQPLIEDLADEFLERRRRGERPTLDEYVVRHPELAGEIREFFPVLGLVEDFKPATDDVSGSIGGSMIVGAGPVLDRLGDFRLLREVGRGGMGVVYEAEQESLGRRVALKVLRSHRLHDPKILIRFHRESKAAARLHHTNIVPVFGVGEHEGIHFYVMQFIRGLPLDVVLDEVRRLRRSGTKADDGSVHEPASTTAAGDLDATDLAQSLATGRFVVGQRLESTLTVVGEGPPAAAVDGSAVTLLDRSGFTSATDSGRAYARSVARVGLQVADALDYAHQHGILHRDIKPSNILLDAHGTIWVTDFGLAKVVSDSDLTGTGDVVGTLRYMAPERFEGRCDVRADIYALGLTLYELLAVRPAFDARDRHALIGQLTQGVPRPLRQIDPTIPRDLDTIVHTAVARNPRERYATAADLRDELERFLTDRPIKSRPISAPERYWRWCQRNPLLAFASSAACVLVVALAVVSTVAAYRNGRLAVELKGQRDEANRNLVHAYTKEAEARRHSRRAGQRFDTLDVIARAMRLARSTGLSEAERLELRNQAIAAMGLPDIRVGWQIEPPGPAGLAVDPSFERYALISEDGTIAVRMIADGRMLLEIPGHPTSNRWRITEFSPDSRYLAAKTPDEHQSLVVWDLGARKLVLTDARLSEGLVKTWAFHPDGRRLAYGRRDGSIVVVDLAGERESQCWPQAFGGATSLEYSPDGSRLAVVSASSGSVHILATESGQGLAQLDNPSTVFHMAWNPRWPNLLAAGLEDNTIQIWDVDTGRPKVTLAGDSYNGLMVAFHPGGDLLASRGWSGVLRLWDIRTGNQILSMPSSWLPDLRFARDGTRLSAHGGAGRVGTLDVSYQTECRSLYRGPGPSSIDNTALAIDGKGRYLAAACASGITLWDLPTGTPLAELPVSGEVKSVQFDPAGALLTSHPMTLRWPITSGPHGSTIGPPQRLQWYQTHDGLSRSRDGRLVALAIYDGGALVFDADQPATSRRLLPHRDARRVNVSPDGRWVVTGSHDRATVKVWNARTGGVVHTFPESPYRRADGFSPDGRWLPVDVEGQGWELVETETWQSMIRLDGRNGLAVFSVDSAIIAHETYYDSYQGAIALVDLTTGRELARIDDPDGARAAEMVFSPDGAQMITILLDQPYIRVWDLRAVRRRLAALDLDWNAAPIGGSAVATAADFEIPRRPRFRVDRGQLDQWIKLAPIKRREQAIADAEEFLKHEPGQLDVRNWLGICCNALAWELVAGSESDRDPPRAVPMADRAVASSPDNDVYLRTLGLAHYRTGRYADAIPVLERALAANRKESFPYCLFIMALCQAKTGDAATARSHFDRACTWLNFNSKLSAQADHELSELRAEAESVLRPFPAKLPDKVFAIIP